MLGTKALVIITIEILLIGHLLGVSHDWSLSNYFGFIDAFVFLLPEVQHTYEFIVLFSLQAILQLETQRCCVRLKAEKLRGESTAWRTLTYCLMTNHLHDYMFTLSPIIYGWFMHSGF